MKRTASFLVVACLLLGTLSACTFRPVRRFTDSSLDYFDTYCEITLYTDREEVFRGFSRIVWEELGICHRLFDIYNTYDGVTNLRTVNECAGIAPVAVDDRILDLFGRSVVLHDSTGGNMNVALGSVLAVWHEYREAGNSVPTEAELTVAAAHTKITDLVIDREAGTVFFTDPGLKLDVGAIAKGYAEERVYQALLAAGYTDFCLNFGGNVFCAGKKTMQNGLRTEQSDWQIGIAMPDGSNGYLSVVPLSAHVLSTSGDYQRYYEVDGVRYCHIIDPDTRYPARYFSSVSVYAADAAVADALSTALFCMSLADGEELLSAFPSCEALWVTPDGTMYRSDGFPGN